MKPAPFSYHAPTNVEELLGLAAEHAETGRVLAGGQSLMPLLNMRRVRVGHLIDLNGVDELDHLERDNGVLAIGSLVRQARAVEDATARRTAPLLAEALEHSANQWVRSRGTVCGNIAFAQPAAELPAIALAMGGEVVARAASSERRIDVDDFFIGPFTTALQPGEVITELRLNRWPESSGHAFFNVSRMRFPVVSVAALVESDEDVVTRCAVALSGAGDAPVRLRAVEAALTGAAATEEAIAEAALLATDGLDVRADDVFVTAAYRTHVAGVLVRRALNQAVERAARAGEVDE
jgi:carbon-monoxide dehydrogenase medium subunit